MDISDTMWRSADYSLAVVTIGRIHHDAPYNGQRHVAGLLSRSRQAYCTDTGIYPSIVRVVNPDGSSSQVTVEQSGALRKWQMALEF